MTDHAAFTTRFLGLFLLIGSSIATTAFGATFTVTTNANSGAGSLLEAIAAANANAGPDTIAFSIGAGGPQTIAVDTPLPPLRGPVVVDGTTQPGFTGKPIITLDGPGGTGVRVFDIGLRIASSSVTIRGLVIVEFSNAGIEVASGTTGATIVGNYIGVDASGSVARGNGDGIRLLGDADRHVIGGATAGGRNVISGNVANGISSSAPQNEGTSDDNLILGNIIGLDASGAFALGNGSAGVRFAGGDRNRIGTPGAGNIISGNAYGILIGPLFTSTAARQPSDNVVQANLIGTDINGSAVVPNRFDGINLHGALNTTVGGEAPGSRNIVSGNGWFGIEALASCFQNTRTCFPAEGTLIAGNYIGTDAAAAQDRGNMLGGIAISGARRTIIRSNVVSGNGGSYAISTRPSPAYDTVLEPSDTLIISNLIGTGGNGSSAIPNDGGGIQLFGGQNTTVGGSGPGQGNLIRFNGSTGIVASPGGRNQFIANSIDSNAGLGIDLGGDGVTPNDPLDADSGDADRQNHPVLSSARVSGATEIRGTFNGVPNRVIRIEFFNSPTADPSGFGEGRTFIGFINVTTGASGNAEFAATMPSVSPGSVITATATDQAVPSTSEFSNAVVAATPAILNVANTSVAEGSAGTTFIRFTVSISEPSPVNVTFQYATANGEAVSPDDYTASSGTALIPAGALSVTLEVPVVGDTVYEPDERFFLNITGVNGATAGDVQGEATVTNDDDPRQIPTVSQWMLLMMALVLAYAGAKVIR